MLSSWRLQLLISRNGKADGHLSPIRTARVSEETKVRFLMIHLNKPAALVVWCQASLVEVTQVEPRQNDHLVSHLNHKKNQKVHSQPSRVKEFLLALVTSRAHLDQLLRLKHQNYLLKSSSPKQQERKKNARREPRLFRHRLLRSTPKR
jgi:hypothetical protein